jgi:hypothetical protein
MNYSPYGVSRYRLNFIVAFFVQMGSPNTSGLKQITQKIPGSLPSLRKLKKKGGGEVFCSNALIATVALNMGKVLIRGLNLDRVYSFRWGRACT